MVKPFMNWDGLFGLYRFLPCSHFLGNSYFGYQYDLNCAFLPLLSWILRACGPRLFFAVKWVCLESVIVSHGVFVLSSLLFYKLSMHIQPNAYRAYCSTLLFIYNPASIHFSSFYTESLYFFLSTIVFLLSGQENDWLTVVSIAMTTTLRSNSVLLVPFVLLPSILSHSTRHQRETLLFWVKTGAKLAFSVAPLVTYLVINAAAFWLGPLVLCLLVALPPRGTLSTFSSPVTERRSTRALRRSIGTSDPSGTTRGTTYVKSTLLTRSGTFCWRLRRFCSLWRSSLSLSRRSACE